LIEIGNTYKHTITSLPRAVASKVANTEHSIRKSKNKDKTKYNGEGQPLPLVITLLTNNTLIPTNTSSQPPSHTPHPSKVTSTQIGWMDGRMNGGMDG
jgi:hypothetical protein